MKLCVFHTLMAAWVVYVIAMTGCGTLAPLGKALLKDLVPVAIDAVGDIIKDKLAQAGGGCVALDIEDDEGFHYVICEPGTDPSKAAPLLKKAVGGEPDTAEGGSICYLLTDAQSYILCMARAVE